jgi:hypothetical protein
LVVCFNLDFTFFISIYILCTVKTKNRQSLPVEKTVPELKSVRRGIEHKQKVRQTDGFYVQRVAYYSKFFTYLPGSVLVFAFPGHPDGLQPLDKGGFPGQGGVRGLSSIPHTY